MLGDLSDHTQYRNNKEWHSSPAQNTAAVVWDIQQINSNDSCSDSSSSSSGGGGDSSGSSSSSFNIIVT